MSSTTPRPAVTLSPLVETCRALPCVVVDFPAPSQGVMGSPLLLPWCQPPCSVEAGATPLHLSVCGPASPTRLPCSCCPPTVQVGSWEFCSGGISSRAISAVMGWLVGPWWAEPMAAPAASDSDHWKSTASTWPLGALLPECLHPPRGGRWHCWRGWVLLQTGPLSAVAPFCSWFRGSEAGTGYKQPLSRWLAPRRAPPPSLRLREQLSAGDRWLSCSAIGQCHRGPLPPALVFKRSLTLDCGKTVFWEASLRSSQFDSFSSKVVTLCLSNSTAVLLASPVASKMNLGSVTFGDLDVSEIWTLGHWARYCSEHRGIMYKSTPRMV